MASFYLQMNKAESERLGNYLRSLGYEETTVAEDADLVLLNSCVVRRSAEARTLNKLGYLEGVKRAHSSCSIVVTGCFVDSNREELRRQFSHIDLFFPPGGFEDFTEWASGLAGSSSNESNAFLSLQPPVSSFITVMQGCNNFCTYCIVPYRRGRERSRPVDEVTCEVAKLVQRGTKEVVLLGQNVNSYGHDLLQKSGLPDLLEELSQIDGLRRLRFLTNHPKDMSLRLIETMSKMEKVCEHLNVPVQSGDDDILQAMGRGYTAAQYLCLVEEIRRLPDVGLSTDIIVGFPGETSGQFQNTLDLLKRVRFDTVHVAAYSPRPDTVASRMLRDDVPAEEKKKRTHEVEALQENIAAEINLRLVGQEVEVLVEGKKRDKWEGRTRNNKLVFFTHEEELRGQLVTVGIEKATAWSLQGRVTRR
jgi:tRNA-2-methylthio-N6-dimethylallyladenosine synthase